MQIEKGIAGLWKLTAQSMAAKYHGKKEIY